jgi:hypothetical protein
LVAAFFLAGALPLAGFFVAFFAISVFVLTRTVAIAYVAGI